MKSTYKLSRGFTLVEIGIVIVITGLIIGGILRGQELINSAKARNIIDQKSSIQTAIVAFSNRYQATAGDLTQAQAAFIGTGVIRSTVGAGNGIIALTATATNESALVFQNLSATSFLSCTACMTVAGNVVSSTANSPTNTAGSFLQYGTVAGSALGVSWLDRLVPLLSSRNTLITGAQLSTGILQEVDIKSDDGAPQTGLFRQSTTGGAGSTATCAPATGAANTWLVGASNCAGAWLF
jgi:hypothetical protein